jgi:hypothetical protein
VTRDEFVDGLVDQATGPHPPRPVHHRQIDPIRRAVDDRRDRIGSRPGERDVVEIERNQIRRLARLDRSDVDVSLLADPSTPRPILTPVDFSFATGAIPEPRIMFELGQ